MSESPADPGPCAAYCEDVQEDTQTTITGTKQSAQVKSKRSKRDGASDSGYSSRTAATNGTQSTSNSSKILNFVGKMAGAKKSSKEAAAGAAPAKTSSKKTSSKTKEGLRVKTNVESREAAARIQLSGEPISRTPSGRSYETSPQQSRSVKPSPPLPQHQPPVRVAPPYRVSTSRPMSLHVGTSGNPGPYTTVAFSPSLSAPTYTYPHPPRPQSSHYQPSPVAYVTSVSPTMALPRQTAYPFEPTLPPQFIPSTAGWEPQYQSPFVQSHPAPLPRRYSMAGPPAIVEYPMVPARTTSRPPVSYTHHTSYTTAVPDEGIFMDENEAYYRRQEEARRRMPPPPQRPGIQHASTTPAVLRRSNRDSLEQAYHTSTSSRTESFGSQMEETRAPLVSRGSSSKNIPVRNVEAPSSPERPRRIRPQSFHAGVDPEIEAERYQAKQRGAIEPQSLRAVDVKKANKTHKTHKSKASDSGSRSSESKKERSSTKRTEVSRTKPSTPDEVSVKVVEGCTATLRRSSKGYDIRVSLNEDSKNRNGRASNREETKGDRKYSYSSRRESLSEAIARGIAPRRSSSSHPVSRRERIEDTNEEINKRLTEKYKSIDDTAVEDDEFSEPETRRKRSEKHEKLAAQKLRGLMPSSESRQSSRSARSAKSSKSNRSVTSPKKAIVAEGQPF